MKSKDNRDVSFLCFGGEDWWYHNQAHIDMQLMRRFARRGTTLYVNSVIMRKPQIGRKKGFTEKLVRKGKSILTGLKKSHAGFWVYSPLTLPVHHISWARPLNEALLRHQIERTLRKLDMDTPVTWVACPSACDTAIKLKKQKLIYQRTDRYEDDPQVDREAILAYDRKLKANADVTVYVNRTLYDEEASQCKGAFFLDHGVDYDIFASAQDNPDIPAEMVDLKKPIVGYFGRLADHKLDVDFLNRIIELLPEFTFVFVGYASPECRNMFSSDNVCLVPKQPYERIPHYGKCFDVAMLPWRVNKWTEAANPIKLKEYLALGKPVVSTPAFTELQKYRDVVYEARTPEDFAACIKKAYSEDGPELLRKRRQMVAHSSWDSKAELMLHELFDEKHIPAAV
jgi:glycosyltransferase involved in cell wall biosynthesis